MPGIEEKIETVKSRFVLGNLLAFVWILLGTYACWLVMPWLGWLFLIFSTVSVYIVIRRLFCNSCYYCRSCTKGLAKLSILFLGANKIPGISDGTVKGMTIFIYAALTILPASPLIYSLSASFEAAKIISLACLFGISAVAIVSKIANRNKKLWKP